MAKTDKSKIKRSPNQTAALRGEMLPLTEREFGLLDLYSYLTVFEGKDGDIELKIKIYEWSRGFRVQSSYEARAIKAKVLFERKDVKEYLSRKKEQILRGMAVTDDGDMPTDNTDGTGDDDSPLRQKLFNELETIKLTSQGKDKVDIIKAQLSAINKNKSDIEETHITQIYLPHQSKCKECPMYVKEMEGITINTD